MSRKSAIIFLAALIIVSCLFYVLYFAYRVQKISKGDATDRKPYEYHVLVCGINKSSENMTEFFRGAKFVASAFDGIAENLETDRLDKNFSLDKILEYVEYSDADGLIIFSDDESIAAEKIENVHGKEIPVVIAGKCKPESKQVSHIISSNYEISRMISRVILDGKWKNPAVFFRQTATYNKNLRIMAGIEKELTEKNIKIQKAYLGDVVDDEIRYKLIEWAQNDSADVVVCFSAEESNLVAQTIIDQNLTDKFSVISVFGNNKTKEFHKKGIVSAVIYIDSWEAGAIAASELFNWKKDGFANQYRQLEPKLMAGGEK